MRILIINNSAFNCNGSEISVYKTTGEFGKELVNLGHNVEYFQIFDTSLASINNFNLKENGINVSGTKRRKSKALTYVIAYIKGAKRILYSDFIYIYCPNTFRYLSIFALVLKKEYGLNVRGEKGINSVISRFLFKHSKCVFTVSPSFTKYIRNINPEVFDKKPTISFSYSDIVKDRTYRTKEHYNILFLGRIDREKGIFELLEAANLLRDRKVYNFTVTIVGDGPEFNNIKILIQKMKLDDFVFLKGALSDKELIKKCYLEADIYILPTYHEGFPRTLYEAMIFGTPIITTLVGGISAIMQDNFNCWCIEPKSVRSIYEKLLQLPNNYTKVDFITRNATSTVASIIHPTRMSHAEHLSNILNENNSII